MPSKSSSGGRKGRKASSRKKGSKNWYIAALKRKGHSVSKENTVASLKKMYKKHVGSGKKGRKSKSSSSSRYASMSSAKLRSAYKKVRKRIEGKTPSASSVPEERKHLMSALVNLKDNYGVSPRKRKASSKGKKGSKEYLVRKVARALNMKPSELRGANLSQLKNLAKEADIAIEVSREKSKSSQKNKKDAMKKLKEMLKERHPRMSASRINSKALALYNKERYGKKKAPSEEWVKEARKYKKKFGVTPKDKTLAQIKRALKKGMSSPKSKSPKKSPRKSVLASKRVPFLSESEEPSEPSEYALLDG